MSAQARPMTGPTAGLLALDLGLAAVLAVLWLAPGAPAQWRTWQAPQPQPPSLDDIDAAQLTPNPAAGAAYPGVLQRPLMDPARRPQAAARAPAAAAAAPAMDSDEPAVAQRLRELLAPFSPGNCPVRIVYSNGVARCELQLGDGYRVRLEDDLLGVLGDWLGAERVRIEYS